MNELLDEPLAPRTTLGIGGPARRLLELSTEAELVEAVRAADTTAEPFVVLGGGSNVVIADEGLDCLVLHPATRGIQYHPSSGRRVELSVAAGENWDALVAACIAKGLAGIECLSGIPGSAGAAPIQNVGAYGQEVGDCLVSVRAYDRRQQQVVDLPAAACGLGYRTSIFKHQQQRRHVILGLTLRLRQGPPAPPRYAELQRVFGARRAQPSLENVRNTVVELRRRKSMLLDPEDPESRSVGSFFVNPLVSASEAEAIRRRAIAAGVLAEDDRFPAFPTTGGLTKLPAAWLIERAGFPKGFGTGPVRLSRHHALAIVNAGQGTAHEVLTLARTIRQRVQQRFGVALQMEPVIWGFDGQSHSAELL